ncbi:DUF1796 family putative cysteine peptidase [Cohnella sp. JJ-181]|uniref:DUF1796 family putative cysteine peptidase n=1 Tax=Cohnella rhizoplanae TaxID=2974897 RepID=UPI0022FF831F|nr:DUF1796 family putative cysteine peptidase [Cohnella sp. JJ-181]CAI6032137.1 hypothetical protein COHCIP112018_00746 [Cohnella sp. JJ-181]
MRLADIKGDYDGIFSLGELCLSSIQLERCGLRPFAGPLDWMSTPSLADVNRLLTNRFAGFMDRDHLQYVQHASDKLLLVKETVYNAFSNHDFFVHRNHPDLLEDHPAVKTKYDRRAERLLEKSQTARRLLFVRCGGSLEEAAGLEAVLTDLVTHDFRILLVNHTDARTLTETNGPLQRVCTVELPGHPDVIWGGNNHFWDQMLSGIAVKESL